MHFVVTASATSNGQPLYRSPSGAWSPTHSEAERFATSQAADTALAQARSEEALVCDPYLIEADPAAPSLHFVSLKERIRASGPTVAIL